MTNQSEINPNPLRPRATRVSVLNVYQYGDQDDFDFYGSLEELIEELQKHLTSVPEEYRKDVKYDIEASGCFEIYYCRPETPEEEEDRVRMHNLLLNRQKERDRETYERLKKQFEGEG